MADKSKNKKEKIRVAVGLSGGVDSAVAATLLKKQGLEVIGFFMKFWKSSFDNKKGGGWNRCCSFEAQQRARQVARVLGIDFYVLNLEKEFKKQVVDYFLKEYKAGKTPNPCVVCNKEIKFKFLISKASILKTDFVATGHYARLVPLCGTSREFPISNFQFPNNNKKNIKLLKAENVEKDQTYFLWKLGQKELSKVLFPLGEFKSKAEIRKLAKKFNLPVWEAKESQEVCFIKDKAENFLNQAIGQKKGKILTKDGKVIGDHNGLWFYTIGQRKGIRLSGGPWFVVDKDFKNNNLIISKDEKDLLKKELHATKVNWVSGVEPRLPLKVLAKTRYRAELAEAVIKGKIGKAKYRVIFKKPQRAITPGQSVVFYLKDELLGGGIIE